MRILIAEDDDMLLTIIKRYVRGSFDVETVCTLSELKEATANSPGAFDLVLVDGSLRGTCLKEYDDLDGFWSRMSKELGITVVVMTGDSSAEFSKVRAIYKPFNVDDLCSTIVSAIEKKSPYVMLLN